MVKEYWKYDVYFSDKYFLIFCSFFKEFNTMLMLNHLPVEIAYEKIFIAWT